ncbi:MAG: hypothetical protein EOM80_14750 [Erysipelotrichia bacterium]|nr:hypothetical protein [Erysipelotrichia bacterium]
MQNLNSGDLMKRFLLLVFSFLLVVSAVTAQNDNQNFNNKAVINNAAAVAEVDKNSPEYYKSRLQQLKKTLYEKTRAEVVKEKTLSDTAKLYADPQAPYVERVNLPAVQAKPMDQAEIDKEVQIRIATEESLTNFGKEFFEEGVISQASLFSGSAPSNYQLGPGDELKIIVWSDLGDETVYDVQVNPEGQVYVPILGVLGVSGLTVGEFKQMVLGRLSEKFKHFKGEVTLTRVRTIQIFVVGEVEKPGAMAISGLATAFTALYQAGGPTMRGSMRNIRVLDNLGNAKEIDLYLYLLSGDRSQDLPLKNGDTVFVPVSASLVKISGMVTRPAIYEINADTSLAAALIMAGNVQPGAYSGRVKVTRWTGDKQRHSFDVSLNDPSALEKFMLMNGDEIVVDRAIEQVGNHVTIEGAVAKPGSYSFADKLTVADLINRAGGIVKEQANFEHGQILRTVEGGREEIIAFNVKFALMGDKDQNINLKAMDRVRVFAEADITADTRVVYIGGAVRRPGQYIYRDGMRLADLVLNANGLSADAAVDAEIARVSGSDRSDLIKANVQAALSNATVSDNVELKPLDRVSVLARGGDLIEPEIVILKGQVKRPGPYALAYRGEKLSSLIKRAGGLTDQAFAEGTVFMRKIENITSENQLEITENVQAELFRQATLDLRADLLRSGAKIDDLKSIKAEVEGEKAEEQALEASDQKTAGLVQKISASQTSDYAGIEMRSQSLKNKMMRIPVPVKKILDGKAEAFEDLTLAAGDQITVPVIPSTVSVLGAVMNPTTILFNLGRSAGYYINRAGGFNAHSDHRRTIVVRANGEVFRMRNIRKIERGDIVLVPPKPRLVRPDALKDWSNIASVLGNLAVVYKIVNDNN